MKTNLRPIAPLLKGPRAQCPHHASIFQGPYRYYSTRTLFTRCIMCHCNEHKSSAVSLDRAVRNCENFQQRVKTGEWNTLSAASAQCTTAKIQSSMTVSSKSSRSEGI